MTILFEDTFLTGDYSKWTTKSTTGNASMEITTEKRYCGLYSSKNIFPEYYTEQYCNLWKEFASLPSTVYRRNYVWLSSLPSAGKKITYLACIFNPAYAEWLAIGVDGYARWIITYRNNKSTSAGYICIPAPTAKKWHCIEAKLVLSAGNGEVRVWIDGEERFSITGLDNVTGETYMPNNINGGAGFFGGADKNYEVYQACIKVADEYIGLVSLKSSIMMQVKGGL